MKTRAAIFALVVVEVLLYAVWFATHPVPWIIGLMAAIPVGAAVISGTARTP